MVRSNACKMANGNVTHFLFTTQIEQTKNEHKVLEGKLCVLYIYKKNIAH